MGNRWGNSENSVRLYFGGSKITADGCCSHEIKRRLLLGRKVITNLDSILKSRDITWPTKVRLVKAIVFSVVMYESQGWTVKKAEHRRIDAFELWCWRRLLRIPWIARRSHQSILKEISPGISLEGIVLKLKLQYFGHLMRRVDSLEKTLTLGGIGGRRRRGRQRMRWLDGITNMKYVSLSEFPELVMDREAWRCAIHGITKSQTWLSNWTELNWSSFLSFFLHICTAWAMSSLITSSISIFTGQNRLRALWGESKKNELQRREWKVVAFVTHYACSEIGSHSPALLCAHHSQECHDQGRYFGQWNLNRCDISLPNGSIIFCPISWNADIMTGVLSL